METVLVDIDTRGVARLTLNRPEVHNAFDDDLIANLIGKLKEVEASENVRVVIFAAMGKSFSAGGDLPNQL
jgi:methylglutaconyl-CoA hydratase